MNIILFIGEAVVETQELAKLYGKTPKDIAQAYHQNPGRFQEGIHYHVLDDRFEEFEILEQAYLGEASSHLQKVYLWTDQGVYEHALLMKERLVWDAYCEFIYLVFRQSEEVRRALQVFQKADDLVVKEFSRFINEGVV